MWTCVMWVLLYNKKIVAFSHKSYYIFSIVTIKTTQDILNHSLENFCKENLKLKEPYGILMFLVCYKMYFTLNFEYININLFIMRMNFFSLKIQAAWGILH